MFSAAKPDSECMDSYLLQLLICLVFPFYRLFVLSFFLAVSGSLVLSVISHVNYLQKFLRLCNLCLS